MQLINSEENIKNLKIHFSIKFNYSISVCNKILMRQRKNTFETIFILNLQKFSIKWKICSHKIPSFVSNQKYLIKSSLTSLIRTYLCSGCFLSCSMNASGLIAPEQILWTLVNNGNLWKKLWMNSHIIIFQTRRYKDLRWGDMD